MLKYRVQRYVGAEVSEALVQYGEMMAAAFVELYNAKGAREWGESWTLDSASRHIARILAQAEGKTPVLALLLNDEDECNPVAGFLFGAAILTPEALGQFAAPDAAAEGISPDSINELYGSLGRTQSFPLYVSVELGVRRPYRGGLKPIADLFRPVLRAAREIGCSHVIGWSAMGKRSLTLFRAFGGEVLADLGGHKHIVYTRNRISTVLVLIPLVLPIQRLYMGAMVLFRRL